MQVLDKAGGQVIPGLWCIGDANGKMMLAHAASAQAWRPSCPDAPTTPASGRAPSLVCRPVGSGSRGPLSRVWAGRAGHLGGGEHLREAARCGPQRGAGGVLHAPRDRHGRPHRGAGPRQSPPVPASPRPAAARPFPRGIAPCADADCGLRRRPVGGGGGSFAPMRGSAEQRAGERLPGCWAPWRLTAPWVGRAGRSLVGRPTCGRSAT